MTANQARQLANAMGLDPDVMEFLADPDSFIREVQKESGGNQRKAQGSNSAQRDRDLADGKIDGIYG